ncbi:MAG: methyltransferase domain-containing protein [Halieaceae bacterium]
MKSKLQDDSGDSTLHYETVLDAWDHLLGEDLHYGYFVEASMPLAAATDALTDQMLLLAELKSQLKVLDIGCGTGKAGCRIVNEYDCQLVGVSPSESCVERANALADSKNLSGNARFEIGDGTALDFEDQSFDRVWVMESSHLMDNKTALLNECARLLRPGGRIVLCDVMLHFKLTLEQVIARRDEFLILKNAFGRARMETLNFYEKQLTDNNLELESARNITKETLPTFARWKENALHNRASVEEHIGRKAWEDFISSCDVLQEFWQHGVMGYGIISARKPV